jgi:hypothetical protein
VSELELCRTRLAEALLRAEQAERELAALRARLAEAEGRERELLDPVQDARNTEW